MQTPTEGAVYHDEVIDGRMVCVKAPDTAGVSMREAESMTVEFELVEDDEWFSIFLDNFGSNQTRVAGGVEDL
jgi:hypothetical protein